LPPSTYDNGAPHDVTSVAAGLWVCTIPLRVSSVEDKYLRSRFEVARQVYNASLGEAMRRLEAAWANDLYVQAAAMRAAAGLRSSRGGDGTHARARRGAETASGRREGGPWTALYRAAYREVGFSDYGLGTYALRLRAPRCDCKRARRIPPRVCPNCGFVSTLTWVGDHLAAFSVQRLGVRAFRTAQRLALGSARQVRFLRPGGITAVDGGSACQEISFDLERSSVVWKVPARPDLILRALVDPADEVMRHGLESHQRSVRVIRRRERGRDRWYAQLTVVGQPLAKKRHQRGTGTAGISVGIRGVGIVHQSGAQLSEFCGELANVEMKLRVLHRRMDRQRRANTPENFHPDGRIKGRGELAPWRDSRRYLAALDELRELYRRQREARRTLQGALANEVLAHCDDISVQVPAFRRLQRRYGRAIERRAPGLFVTVLERKLSPPRGHLSRAVFAADLPLQDDCHGCGSTVTKSPRELRQRWAARVHRCSCGVVMQLDLYRAFLAWCSPGGHLDRGLAAERWLGAQAAMLAAWSDVVGEATVGRLSEGRPVTTTPDRTRLS